MEVESELNEVKSWILWIFSLNYWITENITQILAIESQKFSIKLPPHIIIKLAIMLIHGQNSFHQIYETSKQSVACLNFINLRFILSHSLLLQPNNQTLWHWINYLEYIQIFIMFLLDFLSFNLILFLKLLHKFL